MKYSLYLTAEKWILVSDIIQSGIDGKECINDDEHLEWAENVLKKINQTIVLADDFYIE
jgi:hypothetical protein